MSRTPKIKIPKRGESLYERLQQQALDCVQQLSGKVWTDYNAHDPGVTTLDILNYALTELDFRLNFPLDEYLATPDGKFHPEAYGLFAAEKVFAMNPLTTDDYRNLTLDALDDLEDLQLIPHEPNDLPHECCGWYDLRAELSPYTHLNKLSTGEEALRTSIRQIYHSHRNLCENLHSIAFIKRQKLTLSGEIHTDSSVQPEELLTAIYLEALKLFAPGTHFSKSNLPVSTLYKQIREMRGVASIRSLQFDGKQAEGASYMLGIADKEDIQVRLFRNGEAVQIDIGQVLRHLYAYTNLRHAIRSKSNESSTKDSPTLDSRYHPLSHYSIQNDFPACYAINSHGPAAQESELRRIQYLQFKAYLLIIDLFLAQGLEEINDLPAWMALNTTTAPNNIPRLNDPEYLWDMLIDPEAYTPRQPRRKQSAEANKDRLLDTLDKMYGESTNLPFLRLTDPEANRRRRVNFLRQLPRLMEIRNRGIDLLDASSWSGLEQYVTALLGLDQTGGRAYAIEHLLLHTAGEAMMRPDTQPEETTTQERKGHRLPLEFSLSVVMPLGDMSALHPEYRLRIEELVCERMPAHIRFTIHWLKPKEMELFAKHYTAWRMAWAEANKEAIEWTTDILLSGLIELRNRTQI